MNSAQYYQFNRSEMTDFLPKHYAKVLEIGCGEGQFINNLTAGIEYWGIEQNKEAALTARKRLNKVLIGTYESVHGEAPDNYFDLIICNDVVEHMENHDWFLSHIKNKLHDSGTLVLSIPNVRFLPNLYELIIQRDWRYKSSGVLDKTHLRFFTRKSLIRTLKHSDWVIEKIGGINRYGSKIYSPKRIASYLGQIFLGADTAFMQFGVSVKKAKGHPL